MPTPSNALQCLKCGYTWVPRVAHPRECCNCKSRNWNGKPAVLRSARESGIAFADGRQSATESLQLPITGGTEDGKPVHNQPQPASKWDDKGEK